MNRVPLKAIFTGSDPTALAEFGIGDTIALNQGGTGANNASAALSNLGGVAKVNPATNDAIVRFDGVTGVIQDSNVTISDTDVLSGISRQFQDDGSFTLPAYSFVNASGSGFSKNTGNNIGVSVNASLTMVFTETEIQPKVKYANVDGTVNLPAYSFIGEMGTGMSRGTPGELDFSVLGTHRFAIEGDGTLSVKTPGYENLVLADNDIPNRKFVTDLATGLGTGDVIGPSSGTDNAVVRFDGTTGKLVKNSAVTIDAVGNIITSGTVDGRNVSVDGSNLDSHIANSGNPHGVTTTQIGAIPTSEKGSPNGVAGLDGGGKIPTAQIPASALPEVHIVADATARLALTVQQGDEAKQLNDGSHWIYDGSTWHEYPTGGAGDVAGPASSTDNAVARFDGATGKIIQNSAVTVADNGNIATLGNAKIGHNYNSSRTMSLQSPGVNTYLEILNLAGANRGAFFGIESTNAFAQYNWQGGDITFYTHPTAANGTLRFAIRNNGEVEVKNLALGIVKSAADGTLSSETENTGFNKNIGTGAGTVAAGNHSHTGLGDLFLATIGGQITPAFIDTNRASKTLSVATHNFGWMEAAIGNNDWVQIGHATDADSGHIMPFNATIIGATLHCENDNGNTKPIRMYINNVNNGNIFTTTGSGQNTQINNTLNIDITAGQKLRMRGGPSGGNIADTIITLFIKWRL